MSHEPSANVPLFTVMNHHVADCGRPPQIDGDRGGYHGYFENAYGEQFILEINRETKTAILWCGDAGWENQYPVINGRVLNLVMGPEEIAWLHACWQAAIGPAMFP